MLATRTLITAAITTALLVAACKSSPTPTQPTPTPTPTPTPATVSSVNVTGNNAFTTKGATAQFTAIATLSDGTTQDVTTTASWQSDNAAIASVSDRGLVTAVATGDTTIRATASGIAGTRGVNVRIPPRAPDPAAGQRLPQPDVQAFVFQKAAERGDFHRTGSCPNGRKYENNPWLDYIVDQLRTLDTRWGYNGKPTRGPEHNNGFPVVAAGDEIAYHYGAGPDQDSRDVYLIDILADHCGNNPTVYWRPFTGEEPGFWTGAGRLPSGNSSARVLLAPPN